MLKLRDVDAYYGLSHVLHQVSLSVNEGEIVALLGRNGAGKTTILHAIMGIHRSPLPDGSINFDGKELIGLPPHQIMQHGIGLVPEGREVFPTLSTYENLRMGYVGKKKQTGHWSIDEYMDRVLKLFPFLENRLKNKGSQLSGGEQQMLAIARAMGSRPKLLLLDEPTEGLAPTIISAISNVIIELNSQGMAMLLVTHGTKLAMNISSMICFIEKGIIGYEGMPQDLEKQPEIRQRYLGV